MATKQSADTIEDGISNKIMTAAERTKLTGLPATAQPLDTDLTTIAGFDSSVAGAIASDGGGWVKKTAAQFKTWLTLVKGDVGLANVDNTADASKPVSTAQQTALDAKKNIADIWRRDFSLIGPPNTLSSGAWSPGGYYGFNTAGATNATYNSVWFFDLEPGTWSFDVHAMKSPTSGIDTYEYSFDNSNWVTIAASIDMYNASLIGFSPGGVTGVVVAAQTRLYIRVRNAGTKNASATGYYALVCALHARRTA